MDRTLAARLGSVLVAGAWILGAPSRVAAGVDGSLGGGCGIGGCGIERPCDILARGNPTDRQQESCTTPRTAVDKAIAGGG